MVARLRVSPPMLLSGSSSLISMYSGACIRFTSLAGMLPATLKGIDFALELDSPPWTPAVIGSVRDKGTDIVVGGQREAPAAATLAGISGLDGRDRAAPGGPAGVDAPGRGASSQEEGPARDVHYCIANKDPPVRKGMRPAPPAY